MADFPSRSGRVLRILFAAAEAEPIIKVGGLGDVTGSLPRALRDLNPEQAEGYSLDVRLVIPFHHAIASRIPAPELAATFEVPQASGDPIPARAYLTYVQDLPVYLIAGDPVSAVPEVYGRDMHQAGEKFTFFSLAVLKLCRALHWAPDILHAHDWHAALAVYALAHRNGDGFFHNTRSMLTVHNLPFMGAGTDDAISAFGIPPAQDPRLPYWGEFQPLPMGLSAADVITTVSPTYAREILTPEFGSGLQDFLQMRAGTLYGILNGLDEKLWDPAADTAIAQNYTINTLDHRAANKAALLREAEVDLDPQAGAPLLVLIGRMDSQKGVDLALRALRQIGDLPWQCVLLGTGDAGLEAAARRLELDMPDRMRSVLRFDAKLSRRMYAGGDMLLMPSRYEPCGLAQMIAMRYGCVPVARATGGLQDTIIDRENPAESTGFLFNDATPEALEAALRRALAAFQDPAAWRARQKFGMQQDFRWHCSAEAYARIYTKMIA